jgi:hypothetical protein
MMFLGNFTIQQDHLLIDQGTLITCLNIVSLCWPKKFSLTCLREKVKDAMDKGAHAILHTGLESSAFADGFYFPPTVLTDVNHTMQVMRDESFGPLIGIQVRSVMSFVSTR